MRRVEGRGGLLQSRRVVLEPELRLRAQRFHPARSAPPSDAQLVGDVDCQVAPHRVAHREHEVVAADRLGGRREQLVGEQRFRPRRAAQWSWRMRR